MNWNAIGDALGMLALVAAVMFGLFIAFVLVIWALASADKWLPKRFLKRGRASSAGPSDGARLRGRMRRAAKSTLLLTPSTERCASKLGGEPELPLAMAWPDGLRSPRAFFAQIELSEVRAAHPFDWLPEDGRLYAFHDDERSGFADEVVVLFSQDPAGDPRTPPESLTVKRRFQERRAGFLELTSTPSLDWLGVDVEDIDVSEEEMDALADLPNATFGDELQHRIGGYPTEIQGTNMRLACEHMARGLTLDEGDEVTPAIERASKSWRLLLQIDSDPALGMNWGDGGRLYVFVRAQHAKAGDFSKAVTISQTY